MTRVTAACVLTTVVAELNSTCGMPAHEGLAKMDDREVAGLLARRAAELRLMNESHESPGLPDTASTYFDDVRLLRPERN